jgi:hypothetical protein
MKILITGATGFIGKRLCKALSLEGHDLVILTRNRKNARELIPAPHTAVEWKETQGAQSVAQIPALKKIDAVIHLAGESVAAQRWTSAFKRELRDSRIQSAENLKRVLKQSGNTQLQAFISASAIGYYGDCGDELLAESHPPGSDFLATLCQEWEDQLFKSSEIKARKVALRIGLVFGQCGGALEKMISTFSSGVAAYLGSGKQWVSWIHADDLVAILVEALKDERFHGAINACSPHPLSQKQLTQKLARRLHSFGVVPVPRTILKLIQGEFAVELLSSKRIVPEKLSKIGFNFKYSTIDQALEEITSESHALGFEDYQSQLWINQPVDRVFEFFGSAQNLEIITPPYLHFKIVAQSTDSIQKGTLIDYRLRLHGFPLRWRTEISEWHPGQFFVDTQLRGPYQVWRHTHRFTPFRGGTLVEDRVLYRVPLGNLGKLVAGAFVRKDVREIFNYRSHRIFELFS